MKFKTILPGTIYQLPNKSWSFKLIINGVEKQAVVGAKKAKWQAMIKQCNMIAEKTAENWTPYKDYWRIHILGDPFEKPNPDFEKDEENAEVGYFELSILLNSFKHGQNSWGWYSFDKKIIVAKVEEREDDVDYSEEWFERVVTRAVKFCEVLNQLEWK